MVDKFTDLQSYYQPCTEQLKGVGGIKCVVRGQLKRVPINLGPVHKPGCVVFANFRVVEGREFGFLLGLELLKTIRAHIMLDTDTLTFKMGKFRGSMVPRMTIPLYLTSTVRAQPASFQFFGDPPLSVAPPKVGSATWTQQQVKFNSTIEEHLGKDLYAFAQEVTQYSEFEVDYAERNYLDDHICNDLVPEQLVAWCDLMPTPVEIEEVVLGCYTSESNYPTLKPSKYVQLYSELHLLPAEAAITALEDLGDYPPRRRRGTPISGAIVSENWQKKCKQLIVVTGPAKIGKSCLLQCLQKQGYGVIMNPIEAKPWEFDSATFEDHFHRWAHITASERNTSLLIEESPWMYLARFEDSLAPELRQTLRGKLSNLEAPHMLLLLQCTGVENCRRLGEVSDSQARALLIQMRALECTGLLHHTIDVTSPPQVCAYKVTQLLQRQYFPQTSKL